MNREMGEAAETIEELFHRALAAGSVEERCAIVLSAAPADRGRLEALVAAHFAAADFFKIPADAPGVLETAGSRVGQYRLMEQIGEGGFAVVFAAEQTAPVCRRVALKIVKPGMDSRQVISRFNAERQALAVLDHPHIAKVFDAGLTATGRPYFVMELVADGEPITAYCDRHRLGIAKRLSLLLDVCSAVQHAHQKGIIHRDLKPSNVLVSIRDAMPVVKVIDFGVAKATASMSGGQTLFTELGQLVGTPGYMARAGGRAGGRCGYAVGRVFAGRTALRAAGWHDAV